MVHTPYSSPDSPPGVHPGECCLCVLSPCRAQVGLSGGSHPNEGKSEQPWRWTVDHVSVRRMTVSVNLGRGVVSLEISSCLSFSGCAAKSKIVCITLM